MIAGYKISGMVVISEAVWGCYPFIESIKSFLPSVDELVVVLNVYGRKDGTREQIEVLKDSRIRIIPTIFDIQKYGWVSYGVARTIGYQACKGDIVLMFDGDGILHERDYEKLKSNIKDFIAGDFATGYWNKYRIYKPTIYYNQNKHSGIYNKKILGDRFDFFRDDGKGAPNFSRLTEKENRSKGFSVFLYGYEHVWDTQEVLKFKVNRYGVMIDALYKKPLKTPEVYFEQYMMELVDKVNKEGLTMPIEQHPEIMQNKLRNVNNTHFGFDFFGYK